MADGLMALYCGVILLSGRSPYGEYLLKVGAAAEYQFHSQNPRCYRSVAVDVREAVRFC